MLKRENEYVDIVEVFKNNKVKKTEEIVDREELVGIKLNEIKRYRDLGHYKSALKTVFELSYLFSELETLKTERRAWDIALSFYLENKAEEDNRNTLIKLPRD